MPGPARPKDEICVDDYIMPTPTGVVLLASTLDRPLQSAAFEYARARGDGHGWTWVTVAPQAIAQDFVVNWVRGQPRSARDRMRLDLSKLGTPVTEEIARTYADTFGANVTGLKVADVADPHAPHIVPVDAADRETTLDLADHLMVKPTERAPVPPTAPGADPSGVHLGGDTPVAELPPALFTPTTVLHPMVPQAMPDLRRLVHELRQVQAEWNGRLGGHPGRVIDKWIAFGAGLDWVAENVDRAAARPRLDAPAVTQQRIGVSGLVAAYEDFRAAVPGEKPKSVADLLAPPGRGAPRASLDFTPGKSTLKPFGTVVGASEDANAFVLIPTPGLRRTILAGLLAHTAPGRVQAAFAEHAILAAATGPDAEHLRDLAIAGAVATLLARPPDDAETRQWATDRIATALPAMSPVEAGDWIEHLGSIGTARPTHAAALQELAAPLVPIAGPAVVTPPARPGADVWAPVRAARDLLTDPETGIAPGRSVERLDLWHGEVEPAAATAPLGSTPDDVGMILGALGALGGALADPSALEGSGRTDLSPADIERAAGGAFQPRTEEQRIWNLVLSQGGAAVWIHVPATSRRQARTFGIVGDDRTGTIVPRWIDPREPGLFGAPADIHDAHGALIGATGVRVLAQDRTGRRIDLDKFQQPAPPADAPAPVRNLKPLARPSHPEAPPLAALVNMAEWPVVLSTFTANRGVLVTPQTLEYLEYRLSNPKLSDAVRDRLKTMRGLITLAGMGQEALAVRYLTAPNPTKRKEALTGAVVGAGAAMLRAMVDLTAARAEINSERADAAIISAAANILEGKPAGLDRSLVPRYVSYSARVAWFRHLRDIATAVEQQRPGSYQQQAEEINALIREVLRC
ncbi:hypothetical protein Val02_45240 [Virgisporangium aliadipatigenens]|uniref:Uncharacterized protein n=1 Tax=Virgisporangium aliadipatigenens TaxID=741659 RepID=A0A8J4DS98_9ACTN|nr:hypothetical protein [Virgisporangium aliadipatigenens]GIJ47638.1 hypothetical protein Val02_45240 [Virgisporangium aliadipatigenens]